MAKETVRENFIMSKRLRSLIKAQLDRQTEDLTACARAVSEAKKSQRCKKPSGPKFSSGGGDGRARINHIILQERKNKKLKKHSWSLLFLEFAWIHDLRA